MLGSSPTMQQVMGLNPPTALVFKVACELMLLMTSHSGHHRADAQAGLSRVSRSTAAVHQPSASGL